MHFLEELFGFVFYCICILLYGFFIETAPEAKNISYYFDYRVFLNIIAIYFLGFAGPVWMLSATIKAFRKPDRRKIGKRLLLHAIATGIAFPGLGCLIICLKEEIGLAIIWLGFVWGAVFLGQLLYVLVVALIVKKTGQ